MNSDNNELSIEFLNEMKTILKIIIERYHLKCTGIEDENFTDEIIRISKEYRNPKLPLVCEKVVADNLLIRRLILGKTFDEIAAIAGIPPKTVSKYESGKKKITKNVSEFAAVAKAYGYTSSDIHEIFLYGASFHDLFRDEDNYYLRSKSDLTYVPNLFFDSNGKIRIHDWMNLRL